MKPHETGVLNNSDIYFSTPSQIAQKIHYYPICAGHFFCDDLYHVNRKKYDSLLILHVVEGTFTYVKDKERITVNKGETVMLDCCVPHEYYTDSSLESIWVHVRGANSFELYREIDKDYSNIVKGADSQHIKKLILRIIQNMSDDEPSSEVNISLDIYKILVNFMKQQNLTYKREKNYEDDIQEVKEYISNHLNEDLNVKVLAQTVHMSASHFSRIFKQQTGYSPYDYILVLRLNKAKDLLQKTDMSVSQIAYETGFNSTSNFIYYFTVNEKISPGKFRKLTF